MAALTLYRRASKHIKEKVWTVSVRLEHNLRSIREDGNLTLVCCSNSMNLATVLAFLTAESSRNTCKTAWNLKGFSLWWVYRDTHPVVEGVLRACHATVVSTVGLRGHSRWVVWPVVGGSGGAGWGLLTVHGSGARSPFMQGQCRIGHSSDVHLLTSSAYIFKDMEQGDTLWQFRFQTVSGKISDTMPHWTLLSRLNSTWYSSMFNQSLCLYTNQSSPVRLGCSQQGCMFLD